MMLMTVSILLPAFALTSILSGICELTHNMNFYFFFFFNLGGVSSIHRCFQNNKNAHSCGEPVVGDSA